MLAKGRIPHFFADIERKQPTELVETSKSTEKETPTKCYKQTIKDSPRSLKSSRDEYTHEMGRINELMQYLLLKKRVLAWVILIYSFCCIVIAISMVITIPLVYRVVGWTVGWTMLEVGLNVLTIMLCLKETKLKGIKSLRKAKSKTICFVCMACVLIAFLCAVHVLKGVGALVNASMISIDRDDSRRHTILGSMCLLGVWCITAIRCILIVLIIILRGMLLTKQKRYNLLETLKYARENIDNL